MHGRPVTQSTGEASPSHPYRWRILGVLVLALLVTSIDHTIINVAMPQLVEGLNASSADLQWIVASYTIVFAGLLLTAGSLGDRFGRRHAPLPGPATFPPRFPRAAPRRFAPRPHRRSLRDGCGRRADHADHVVDPRQRVRRSTRTRQGDRG